MGAKESRIGFLSYEEALRRVTDVELKRLKDAFKRTCGLSYYMGQHCFIREVLGDGVPPKVAESTGVQASVILTHGLTGSGSWTPERNLSSCGTGFSFPVACEIFLACVHAFGIFICGMRTLSCGIWDLVP